MILGAKQHTAGDTKKWTIEYEDWLDNTASIAQFVATSPSSDLTIANITILGHQGTFQVVGGVANEQVVVALVMTDSVGNVKNDTISFTVVPP
jgi:hypothetical protein